MAEFIKKYFGDDLWRIRASRLSRTRSFWIRSLRILVLSFKQFHKDKCNLRASALTFYSLLSIVPVLAMLFGIAKGFGLEKKLEAQLLTEMQSYQTVMVQVIDFSRTLLENTKGGLVAGVGVIFLFWAIIKVLGQIEESFNDIWGVQTSRSMGRKFTDYLSLMLICPLLFIMSGSLNVYLVSQIHHIAEKMAILGVFSSLILMGMKLFPLLVIAGLFSFIYVYMPNTNVRVPSGILGGLIAGIIYQLVQWAYIRFQIGVANYGAIYGSFAALPLFLVWLQLSWLVVLLGAEISFAHQNVDTYEFEPDCQKASIAFRKTLAVAVVEKCVSRFIRGEKPVTDNELSRELEIPVRLVRQILHELVGSGVLTEIPQEQAKALAYQPGMAPETLTVKKVLDSLEQFGTDNIPVAESEEMREIQRHLALLRQRMEDAPENVLIKKLALPAQRK
ncbi:MAG: YihY/virulence factor BrkB family protein [Candidatus Omnitrophota bacterium]